MRDHFSKFSWGYALPSKHAAGVAAKLKSTFCQFSSPEILQSDNGLEFVASVITDLVKVWPGTRIIRGLARHPQSQGCVERGNQDLEMKLGNLSHVLNTKRKYSKMNSVLRL